MSQQKTEDGIHNLRSSKKGSIYKECRKYRKIMLNYVILGLVSYRRGNPRPKLATRGKVTGRSTETCVDSLPDVNCNLHRRDDAISRCFRSLLLGGGRAEDKYSDFILILLSVLLLLP